MEEHLLKVNKNEITRENAFNRDLFEIENKYDYSKVKKAWL